MKSILVLLLAIAFVQSQLSESYGKSYESYKLYAVVCQQQRDVQSLMTWEHELDFWSLPGLHKTSKILVDPSRQSAFEAFLSDENFNYTILIENVQDVLVDAAVAVAAESP